MEHIFFEVQLCIKISIFKEKHVFDILIILCLMTSLQNVFFQLGYGTGHPNARSHMFTYPVSVAAVMWYNR